MKDSSLTVPVLVIRRDDAIKDLWISLRRLSDCVDMTDEDAALFEMVAMHSTIQNALKPKP